MVEKTVAKPDVKAADLQQLVKNDDWAGVRDVVRGNDVELAKKAVDAMFERKLSDTEGKHELLDWLVILCRDEETIQTGIDMYIVRKLVDELKSTPPHYEKYPDRHLLAVESWAAEIDGKRGPVIPRIMDARDALMELSVEAGGDKLRMIIDWFIDNNEFEGLVKILRHSWSKDANYAAERLYESAKNSTGSMEWVALGLAAASMQNTHMEAAAEQFKKMTLEDVERISKSPTSMGIGMVVLDYAPKEVAMRMIDVLAENGQWGTIGHAAEWMIFRYDVMNYAKLKLEQHKKDLI